MIRWRFIRWTVLLCVLSIFILGQLGSSALAQTDTVTPVLKKAVDALSKTLPKPFPGLDTYTFTSETFPDAGLGCPAKGQTYPAAPTPGYSFLLTVKGVIYEVHTNLDGSATAVCDQTDVKQAAVLSVYRSPLFSIAYPQAWNVTPRSTNELYFGLSTMPVCTQPGMIVTLLGAEPSGKTADALLDDYQKANTALTPLGARSDVGSGAGAGRSITLNGACTDGTPRSSRVSTFVAYGKGYRVITFAPQAAFNQWSDVFQKINEAFSASAAGAGGGNGAAVIAPDHAPQTLLVTVFNGNIYMANVADLPGAPFTRDANLINGTRRYANPRISPDGKHVVFVDAARGILYVASVVKNSVPFPLTDKLNSDYPPAWSPDGSQIAYVSGTSPATVQAIRADNTGKISLGTLSAVGTPPAVGTPSVSTPCTTNNADPAATLFSLEAGSPLLEWPSAKTLLISQACGTTTAQVVAQLDTVSGQVTPLVTMSHAHLSPSKTMLAGLIDGKLALFDLGSRQTQPLNIAADQVAWRADGTALFYTTRTLKTPLLLQNAAAGYAAFQSADNALTLHRYTISGGQDSLLYTGEGFAIGTIAPDADGSGLLFTLIQNDSALLEGITNKVSAADLERLAPVTQLYWLSLPTTPDEQPILLAANTWQPSFGPAGSTAVIGMPVAPRAGATNIPGG